MIYLLPHLIERACDRFADKEAMRFNSQALTYEQLLSKANQLAHSLVELGVSRGDRVGVLMPRCLESAVGVYGIMQAGAAFVPLDVQTPTAGLRALIEDCGVQCVVTHDYDIDLLDALALQCPSLQVCIGVEQPLSRAVRTISWHDLEQFPSSAPRTVVTVGDDLAYIMYSSGSTGRPKGIMHTHFSGLSYAELSAETYRVQPGDRIGNHSPLHFDMSTFGYLTGPFAAATTILISNAHTKLPASLSQLMERERLTIWYSVPFALIQLLYHGVIETRDLSSLRWVLFGGEPFAPKHLRRLMKCWPHAEFANVYGPAEVNQCTHYSVPETIGTTNSSSDAPIPLGRVWRNTEEMIVDENEDVVEPGESGELLIRSPTMMKGYWGRADLNAKAFYRQQVYSGFERIFYRTGDHVCTTEDGNLVFLGRLDRQIKLRGYRIELDELESTLAAHAEVEEAAVYPVRDSRQDETLEAAVVLHTGTTGLPEDFVDYITTRLPAYAVPQRIEVLQTFPRTTSGKIDRRDLQTKAESRNEVGHEC